MFIEFSNTLINTDYILKIYIDRAKEELKHPRPLFIRIKMIDEKMSENEDSFENFATSEEFNERYQELVDILTSKK